MEIIVSSTNPAFKKTEEFETSVQIIIFSNEDVLKTLISSCVNGVLSSQITNNFESIELNTGVSSIINSNVIEKTTTISSNIRKCNRYYL